MNGTWTLVHFNSCVWNVFIEPVCFASILVRLEIGETISKLEFFAEPSADIIYEGPTPPTIATPISMTKVRGDGFCTNFPAQLTLVPVPE